MCLTWQVRCTCQLSDSQAVSPQPSFVLMQSVHPGLLCSNLCPPTASELHVLNFHCLPLSPVHSTIHLNTRHGHTASEPWLLSMVGKVSWPHPSWRTQGGHTGLMVMAPLQDSQKPTSCPRPASAPAAAACSPLQDAVSVQPQVFAGRQPSMQWQPPRAQQLLACKPPSS